MSEVWRQERKRAGRDDAVIVSEGEVGFAGEDVNRDWDWRGVGGKLVSGGEGEQD